MAAPRDAFQSFAGALAVVTGGGDGMGRSLCTALAAEGCSVAFCDVNEAKMRATLAACEAAATGGAAVTAHACDVSSEAQVLDFARAVAAQHRHKGRKVALFNNAGIGLGSSFVRPEDREDWEKCFNVCWYGVYYCCRAFMPMLLESSAGYIVNTSSVNGFWASVGFLRPHSSYCAAKFAVKGFTEALINDLKLNAPHVRAAVVMPGHIGTGIGETGGATMWARYGAERIRVRQGNVRRAIERLRVSGDPDYAALEKSGLLPMYTEDITGMSDEELRKRVVEGGSTFRNSAPTSADAAAVDWILAGVRRGDWRILVGDDAVGLDKAVRANPEEAYRPDFFTSIVSSLASRSDKPAPQGSAAPPASKL